jgi:hypothetical protein
LTGNHAADASRDANKAYDRRPEDERNANQLLEVTVIPDGLPEA